MLHCKTSQRQVLYQRLSKAKNGNVWGPVYFGTSTVSSRSRRVVTAGRDSSTPEDSEVTPTRRSTCWLSERQTNRAHVVAVVRVRRRNRQKKCRDDDWARSNCWIGDFEQWLKNHMLVIDGLECLNCSMILIVSNPHETPLAVLGNSPANPKLEIAFFRLSSVPLELNGYTRGTVWATGFWPTAN